MRRRAGFTLVEMVVSIVLLGIVGALLAPLLRGPIDSYVDSRERARLSASADNALRRLARELRLALPNSLRVQTVDGRTFLEFLLTTGGGRYRALPTAAGAGNPLAFGAPVSQFDVLGPLPASAGAAWVVAGNLSATAADEPNAYLPVADPSSSRAACGNCAANPITLAQKTFPLAAEFDSRRFFLVSGPVTYECDPAGGVLRRYDGYAIASAQPAPPGGAGIPVLTGLAGCAIGYGVVNQDIGVVSLSLGLTAAGDAEAGAMTLVRHVQVGNSP